MHRSQFKPGKLDLKIGIDARYVENRISGIERYTLNLLRGIVAAGSEFRIVTIINNKTAVPADLQRSGKLELVEVSSGPRGLANQLVLPGTIGRLGLKLLHHPDCFGPLMVPVRMVITIHDMIGITCRDLLPASTKSRWVRTWKTWLKLQCQRAGAIVTVSDYSANDIVRILKVDRWKIHVIANAIEPMRLEPKIRAADFLAERGISGSVLLYVGRADPYKNLVGLLRAFELVRSKYGEPIHLIIAGERDPRYMQAEDEMHRLGLEKRVHFMGYLSEDELQCCYKSARVFVFPSLYEGFGLPPLEAMSLGVPVVSSNRTAMPEVLGDAAVYVNPESPEEMAEGILKVLADSGLARRLSRAGKERAKQFSLLEMGRRHLELYEALLNSKVK